jgi:hypothetical protein
LNGPQRLSDDDRAALARDFEPQDFAEPNAHAPIVEQLRAWQVDVDAAIVALPGDRERILARVAAEMRECANDLERGE